MNWQGEENEMIKTHRNEYKIRSNEIKQNLFGSPKCFKFKKRDNRLSEKPQFMQTIRATSSYENKKFFT